MGLRRFATLAIIGLLLGSCALFGGPGPSLDGEWRLTGGTTGGDPMPMVAGAEPTLRIKGDQAGGQAACNSYGGTLTIAGGHVGFSDLSQTEMACDADLMASEAAFLSALGRVTGATRSDDTLQLRGDAVELTFTNVPPVPDAALIGTTWVLDGLTNADTVSSVPDPPPTMLIAADGALSITSGCRTFEGAATVTPKSLDIRSPLTVTGCLPGFSPSEDAIMAIMDGPVSVDISGTRLTLTAPDGAGLVFRTR